MRRPSSIGGFVGVFPPSPIDSPQDQIDLPDSMALGDDLVEFFGEEDLLLSAESGFIPSHYIDLPAEK